MKCPCGKEIKLDEKDEKIILQPNLVWLCPNCKKKYEEFLKLTGNTK
jgi:hypothetical protein